MSELTQEDLDLMNRFAYEVERRGMSVPAIMFLEMHRPMSFVMSSMMITVSPLMKLFFTAEQYDRVSELMESRENVERLIQLIEDAARNGIPCESNENHPESTLSENEVKA